MAKEVLSALALVLGRPDLRRAMVGLLEGETLHREVAATLHVLIAAAKVMQLRNVGSLRWKRMNAHVLHAARRATYPETAPTKVRRNQ